jgi:hypothetical protein
VKWNTCSDASGADFLTLKGSTFMCAIIDEGVYIDFYNLHADAGLVIVFKDSISLLIYFAELKTATDGTCYQRPTGPQLRRDLVRRKLIYNLWRYKFTIYTPT